MHHAYVYEGSGITDELRTFFKKHQLLLEGTPDASFFSYERLGVDEVRRIVARSQLKPFSQERHVIIVSFATATIEAQNALLKILEEPTAHTAFVLITPQGGTLLPTVRSRVEIITGAGPVILAEAEAFLQGSLDARLDIVKTLVSKDSDTDERQLQRMTHFLTSLEQLLAQKDVAAKQEGFQALYRTRRSIMMPGAPLKPLFEQLAFLL